MIFITLYPASYPTDPFFPLVIVSFYIFLLGGAGFVLGSILVKKVRGKIMIIGSAVYWVFTFLYLTVLEPLTRVQQYQNPVLYSSFAATVWSTFLVFFADITYAVRYIVGKRKNPRLP